MPIINIYQASSINTLNEFVNYYDMKMREFLRLHKGNTYYRITLNGRFRTHLEKIWAFLSRFDQFDIKHYIDSIFKSADSVSECLPHRFFGKKNVIRYCKYIHDKQNRISDKKHLHMLVELELNGFLDEIKSVSSFKNLFTDKIRLEHSIRFFNFPPSSILATSKTYQKWYLSLSDKERSQFVNPEKYAFLKPILKQHLDIVSRVNAVLEGDLSI